MLWKVYNIKLKTALKNPSFLAGLIYFGLAFFVLRKIIFLPGTIGLRSDWSFPAFGSSEISGIFYLWSDSSLGVSQTYPSGYLFNLVLGILSYFVSGPILSKLILFLLIFFAGFFFFNLANNLGLSKKAAFLSGLFYLTTPVIFNKAVAGHISYLLAYALAPFVFSLFIKATQEKFNLKKILLTGLVFALAGSQIQFFVMLGFLLFFYTLFCQFNRKTFLALGIILGVTFLVHFSWLLPLFSNTGLVQSLSFEAAVRSWLWGSSNLFYKAIRLLGWYFDLSVFTDMWIFPLWKIVSYTIPSIALLALFLNLKEKKVWFFSLFGFFFALVAIGINPPLGRLYQWFFYHFPFTNMFREIYHWMFLPAFCYAVLIGYALDRLFASLPKLKYLIFSLGFLILIIYGFPILSGNFLNQVQVYQLNPAYKEVYQWLKKEKEDFRVLWLPMTQPIQYDDLKYAGVDPLIEFSPKYSLSQFELENVKPNSLRNFIEYSLYNKNTQNLGELLAKVNVKYLIFREDSETKYPEFSYLQLYPEVDKLWNGQTIKKVLDNQKDLKIVKQIGPATIYENQKYLPHLYIAKPVTSPEDFRTLFSQKAVFFQEPFKAEETIEPGRFVRTHANAKDGWVRSLHWFWYNPLFAASYEDGIFSLTQDVLEIPYQLEPGDFTLYLKVFSGPRQGKIKIKINNEEKILETKTQKEKGFLWLPLTKIKIIEPQTKIVIENLEGENNIAKIVFTKNEQAINVPPSGSENASFTYQKLNPTKYRLKIHSKEPFYLLFSENYDPNWVLKSPEKEFGHFSVNGYANAYLIDQGGEFEAELSYQRQKLYAFGLFISFLTIICLATYLCYGTVTKK